MQQATVNLFADMGVQPVTLISGLVAAAASTDTTAPRAAISSPSAGATVQSGTAVTISGTASDVGGVVGGVEVSTDGGTTWHPASGRGNWSYTWRPGGATGSATVQARATDDSGNIGAPASLTVTVVGRTCPCSVWSNSVVPGSPSDPDASSTEVGVKFSTDTAGTITGIRFYKGSLNTGTHVGSLWSSSGTLLASATFAGESASGWQQVNFSSPVAVTANTTYVASYFTSSGHYSVTQAYFTSAYINGPLTAPASTDSGGNGVYSTGASNTFPTSTYQSTNYWVDVVFSGSS
jgi:hypothetical protein